MRTVLDTGVVVAGIFWTAEPQQCLVALARRRYTLVLSEDIFQEYQSIASRLKERYALPRNPQPWLDWLRSCGRFVESPPLPQPVCRDLKDDKFLACALAAGASYVVARDLDLLVLEKPFGIGMVTPRKFLSLLAEKG